MSVWLRGFCLLHLLVRKDPSTLSVKEFFRAKSGRLFHSFAVEYHRIFCVFSTLHFCYDIAVIEIFPFDINRHSKICSQAIPLLRVNMWILNSFMWFFWLIPKLCLFWSFFPIHYQIDSLLGRFFFSFDRNYQVQIFSFLSIFFASRVSVFLRTFYGLPSLALSNHFVYKTISWTTFSNIDL